MTYAEKQKLKKKIGAAKYKLEVLDRLYRVVNREHKRAESRKIAIANRCVKAHVNLYNLRRTLTIISK